MKYKVNLNAREYEIIAEDFSFYKYYRGLYDSETKLGLTREAWRANTPLYLHDVGIFNEVTGLFKNFRLRLMENNNSRNQGLLALTNFFLPYIENTNSDYLQKHDK
ncbi:MAG: hypothetical protein ABIK19_05560 [candidate division WOR-3 bacterium]